MACSTTGWPIMRKFLCRACCMLTHQAFWRDLKSPSLNVELAVRMFQQ
jgi:hypothetical protein